MKNKITLSTLERMKAAQEKIAVLTAYDAGFARLAESAGVEVILVGDSLGMVVQGHDSTLPVTVEEMVYHTAMVNRGCSKPLLIADMPFMSHGTPRQALDNAGQLMKEGGAHMVKLEGGHAQVETVRHLTDRAVPVCAHLGLLPQSIHQLGGYKVQGRDSHSAERILNDAHELQQAGAQMLVLECVPELLAREVSLALDIPVIGIGAGRGCDGQVLVLHDMLGITPGKAPVFSRNFMQDADSIEAAIQAYVDAVHSGEFPAEEHCFQ
ncbi:3-methyl-2-oxobutanoate hydroxymethyltransferase [Thiolapillus sp.]